MNTDSISRIPLFHGMTENEFRSALEILSAGEKSYKKGAVIFHAGDTTDLMGVVLAGSVTIESNDIWGNRTILSHIGINQFFAETYAWLENEPMLVDAVANEECRILFIRIGTLGMMTSNSAWQTRILKNLLTIAAHRNLALSGRSFNVSPKHIRNRVMSYLNSVSLQKKSREFDIPFDRQQLADYLNVERTALSKELGKMQKDGLIHYNLNHFVLLSHGSGKDYPGS